MASMLAMFDFFHSMARRMLLASWSGASLVAIPDREPAWLSQRGGIQMSTLPTPATTLPRERELAMWTMWSTAALAVACRRLLALLSAKENEDAGE
jgi:hypothetical protein